MRSEIELNIREDEVSNRVNKYGEQLYHYTSIPAMQGILENKELWLGNTAIMNDKKEGKDFIENLHSAVLDYLSNDKEKDICESIFGNINKRLVAEYPFVTCFSMLGDNAAQWERYADNAKGVCISFNSRMLRRLFFYQEAIVDRVFYLYNIKKHELYNELVSYFDKKDFNKDFENKISNYIIVNTFFRKHSSFCTEEEIRLLSWKSDIKFSKVDYITYNDRIKKVLKVSLKDLCDYEDITFEDLFSNIVIAPRSLQTEYELKEYILSLNMKKLADNISVSKCPLR